MHNGEGRDRHTDRQRGGPGGGSRGCRKQLCVGHFWFGFLGEPGAHLHAACSQLLAGLSSQHRSGGDGWTFSFEQGLQGRVMEQSSQPTRVSVAALGRGCPLISLRWPWLNAKLTFQVLTGAARQGQVEAECTELG